MKAVQPTVTAAASAATRPKIAQIPSVLPRITQPTAKSSAGTYVATDATPSRESHELRHCEKARQARSGWPRWKVEDSSPTVTLMRARASDAAPKPRSAG